MRPKKVVLCVAASELTRSVERVVLETRGYRALRASSASEALAILEAALPDTIDLVLLHLPLAGEQELLSAARRLHPEIRSVVLSDKPSWAGPGLADLYIGKGMAAPIELYERIRLLLVKKTGPKKPVGRALPDVSRKDVA